MLADLDCHLSIKPFQKVEQFVRCKPTEMPIHQVGHIGLGNPQNVGDFSLFQPPVFEDCEDVVSDLSARQKLIGLFEPQIREDIPRALLEFNWFSLFRAHALTPVLPKYLCLIRSTSRFGVSMPFLDFF